MNSERLTEVEASQSERAAWSAFSSLAMASVIVMVREAAVRSRRSTRWRVTVDRHSWATRTDPAIPASTTATAAPRSAPDLVLAKRSARTRRGTRPRQRIVKFVQSPRGQQLLERAKVEASKPENRRKLDQLRRRYLDKRR